jgi:hypothetical protein
MQAQRRIGWGAFTVSHSMAVALSVVPHNQQYQNNKVLHTLNHLSIYLLRILLDRLIVNVSCILSAFSASGGQLPPFP